MTSTPRTDAAIHAMCEALSNDPLIIASRTLELELYSALEFAERHASTARRLELQLAAAREKIAELTANIPAPHIAANHIY